MLDSTTLNDTTIMGLSGDRTLLAVTTASWVKIHHLSVSPNEAEVLLPFGCRFHVDITDRFGDVKRVSITEHGESVMVVVLDELRAMVPLTDIPSRPRVTVSGGMRA